MQAVEYSKMAEVEDRMWWYRALHRHLRFLLRKYVRSPRPEVLDAGCGTGGFLKYLVRNEPSFELTGVDLWPEACKLATQRSGRTVRCASIHELPFPDKSFDAIVSADVLYHEGIDVPRALAEARRCLRPGGVMVLNNPAYEWMRSYHDESVKTAHRFTAGEMRRLLAQAGFSVPFCCYWNTLLFPLIVLRRKILRTREDESDVHPYSAPAEFLFNLAMGTEQVLLRAGLRFPYGLSVLAAAVRPSSDIG